MTIKKYFLWTSFIWFFMFFSNAFVHSEDANAQDPFKVFKNFNIQIVKDIKTSEEMVNILSLQFGVSNEDLQEVFLNSEIIGNFLSITPEKVKDVSAPLLEKTKRKIIIYIVCTGIMAESLIKLEDVSEELENVAPTMKDLLKDTQIAIISACTGYDLSARVIDDLKKSSFKD